MFGDDLNPTVMTERVGSGRSFGHVREGAASWQERLGGHGQEGSEKPDWPRNGQRKQGGNATTTNGCKLYENMQMQCAGCYEMRCMT